MALLVDDDPTRLPVLTLDDALTAHPRSGRGVRVLFTTASFLGSFLLFLVQPMVARFLLPVVGGSSSLWNTAMVFFQVLLLVGYSYAHYSTTRFGRRQPATQVAVVALPLVTLPIALPDGWVLGTQIPSIWVLVTLAVMVGLPFFALSTSSPTLQRWFSLTDHPAADDPYFLYAAGNVGSVLALLGYPLVLERTLSLDQQAWFWAVVYGAFVAATVACALVTRRTHRAVARTSAPAEPIVWARRGRWVLWAFVPSALMIGVTGHLAADVASFPLLWVLPLLLYLTTFVIAFGKNGARRSSTLELAVLLGSITVAVTIVRRPAGLAVIVGVHLLWFFAAALVAHKRLAADRPAPARLTEFFSLISVGGALGGVFASLVAPVVFDTVLEYPIAIVLALVIVPLPEKAMRLTHPLAVVTLALAVVAAFVVYRRLELAASLVAIVALIAARPLRRPELVAAVLGLALVAHVAVPPGNIVFQDRSFFGVSRVSATAQRTTLVSGTTVHGYQMAGAEGPTTPTSYYARSGPVGQIMDAIGDRDTVGVIGLGTGTVATYGRPGDQYVYFEIDPVVIDVATTPEYFGFLSESRATIDIREGDGRQGVAERERVVRRPVRRRLQLRRDPGPPHHPRGHRRLPDTPVGQRRDRHPHLEPVLRPRPRSGPGGRRARTRCPCAAPHAGARRRGGREIALGAGGPCTGGRRRHRRPMVTAAHRRTTLDRRLFEPARRPRSLRPSDPARVG